MMETTRGRAGWPAGAGRGRYSSGGNVVYTIYIPVTPNWLKRLIENNSV